MIRVYGVFDFKLNFGKVVSLVPPVPKRGTRGGECRRWWRVGGQPHLCVCFSPPTPHHLPSETLRSLAPQFQFEIKFNFSFLNSDWNKKHGSMMTIFSITQPFPDGSFSSSNSTEILMRQFCAQNRMSLWRVIVCKRTDTHWPILFSTQKINLHFENWKVLLQQWIVSSNRNELITDFENVSNICWSQLSVSFIITNASMFVLVSWSSS